ncbi:MAG TPA: hypothetical protein VHC46_02685 [Thermodesulfobacteriota bacterium]|nr:hypothetical protein [Thermodesulfobacteriota bacterium]
MLSPLDYSLIQDWKKRQVPREIVLKGINRAFSESGLKHKRAPRSLRHCAGHVEACIEEFCPPERERKKDPKRSPAHADTDPAGRLAQLINAEKNPAVRGYYTELRKKLLGLESSSGDMKVSAMIEIERGSLEEFFSGLPDKDREKIGSAAEEMIRQRARYMTKSAYDESLVSFRNEILAKKYGIKCIIS